MAHFRYIEKREIHVKKKEKREINCFGNNITLMKPIFSTQRIIHITEEPVQ
jgi:hypothetical protein